MTSEQEKCLVDALDKRSKEDRLFAYILLIVVTFVVGIGGYNLSQLTTSLSDNMKSLAVDMRTMRYEVKNISRSVKSMDESISIMANDIHTLNTTFESMEYSVKKIDKHINYMHKDMEEMNKINPFRKIF